MNQTTKDCKEYAQCMARRAILTCQNISQIVDRNSVSCNLTHFCEVRGMVLSLSHNVNSNGIPVGARMLYIIAAVLVGVGSCTVGRRGANPAY
eukprot:gene43162-54731_t